MFSGLSTSFMRDVLHVWVRLARANHNRKQRETYEQGAGNTFNWRIHRV